MTRKWFVVTAGDRDRYETQKEYEASRIWTVSLNPENPGWETDDGYPGYGLSLQDAQFLCAAANEKENREEQVR